MKKLVLLGAVVVIVAIIAVALQKREIVRGSAGEVGEDASDDTEVFET
ncbi:MAG: hypothetical protein ACR2N7_03180 [Acidimicrobiia bacterium]